MNKSKCISIIYKVFRVIETVYWTSRRKSICSRTIVFKLKIINDDLVTFRFLRRCCKSRQTHTSNLLIICLFSEFIVSYYKIRRFFNSPDLHMNKIIILYTYIKWNVCVVRIVNYQRLHKCSTHWMITHR